MISQSHIKIYAKKLGERFLPSKIILFGSYASGNPHDDSDVDLLIIMEHKRQRNIDQAIDMRLEMDAPFPIDMIVKRPSDIVNRLALGDTFVKTVLQEGKVLYEQTVP